jgi:RNA polymerase sigma-70 factor, ECF subfamily
MNVTSDESLLHAITAGSEDALAELIRRHRRSVSSVVRRIISCPQDVEEAVQDVFVIVWRQAPRFRGEAKATTWIHTIARNTAVSNLRRSRGLPSMERFGRDPGDLASERPDPERQAVESDLARKLVARFEKLSAVHRAVLIGMVRHSSATRVAANHGVVVGTMKSRLHRARRALRAVLLRDQTFMNGRTVIPGADCGCSDSIEVSSAA